jgi:hypothetical protein
MLSEHYKNRLEETVCVPGGVLVRTEIGKLKQGFRSCKNENNYIA